MGAFPSDFDISTFVKAELELVCFAEYSLYLHFGGGLLLTIESVLEHRIDASSEPRRCTFPITSSALMQLVGRSVTEARVANGATLHLMFDKRKHSG